MAGGELRFEANKWWTFAWRVVVQDATTNNDTRRLAGIFTGGW